MRRPAFWDSPYDWRALALWPLSVIYGSVTAARMKSDGYKASVPVLCAGNFVAGGAGKTPLVRALAETLKSHGHSPFVVTRGYGGRLTGPVQVKTGTHSTADAGDEALLLARELPVIVSKNRVAGVREAEKCGAGCVILDDGFQNPSVQKHIGLVAVDAARPVGNGYCVPAGPLRAPLKDQMRHATAVVLIHTPGRKNLATPVVREAARSGHPVISARLEMSRDALDNVRNRAFAFAGIGLPEKFYDGLTANGIDVAATRSFPDHHPFTGRDAAQLLADAKALGADLVTTEKDIVRLDPERPVQKELLEKAVTIPVKLKFDDAERIYGLIAPVLRKMRAHS